MCIYKWDEERQGQDETNIKVLDVPLTSRFIHAEKWDGLTLNGNAHKARQKQDEAGQYYEIIAFLSFQKRDESGTAHGKVGQYYEIINIT